MFPEFGESSKSQMAKAKASPKKQQQLFYKNKFQKEGKT